jgi:hypothetical protein
MDEPTPTREGLPWMPEEILLVVAEGRKEPITEAFRAIQQLREAAIAVVGVHTAGGNTSASPLLAAAITALEAALLAGIEDDEAADE